MWIEVDQQQQQQHNNNNKPFMQNKTGRREWDFCQDKILKDILRIFIFLYFFWSNRIAIIFGQSNFKENWTLFLNCCCFYRICKSGHMIKKYFLWCDLPHLALFIIFVTFSTIMWSIFFHLVLVEAGIWTHV